METKRLQIHMRNIQKLINVFYRTLTWNRMVAYTTCRYYLSNENTKIILSKAKIVEDISNVEFLLPAKSNQQTFVWKIFYESWPLSLASF